MSGLLLCVAIYTWFSAEDPVWVTCRPMTLVQAAPDVRHCNANPQFCETIYDARNKDVPTIVRLEWTIPRRRT